MNQLLQGAIIAVTGTWLFGCSPAGDAGPVQLNLRSVSNKPYLISGGNALLEVNTSASAEDLRLVLNGIARQVRFVDRGMEEGRHRYQVLVQGLHTGGNSVAVRAGDAQAELQLVNYPISGPIISGNQQAPYFCLGDLAPDDQGQPRRFAIGNGEYLDGNGADTSCHLPTRVDYVYRSLDGRYEPLPETERPADLMMTTTRDGREVPYIVRLETGTINRAIYQIAILHDPLTPVPSALGEAGAWNRRLVYTYGGGCEAGYFQGESTGGVLQDDMLSAGYAVASSTLNVNAQGGCNDVLSAETTFMVKEHFIETYGEPMYTIGFGGSGGAMQQLLIAGAYPGILDGLLPSLTFADAVSYLTDSQECAGPLRAFVNDPAKGLDDATKNAIGGWSMWSLCESSLGDRPRRVAPYDCPDVIPESARYDALSNPKGARCSVYDGMRNIFGERSYPEVAQGRQVARSPHDNVGVQYGLAALNAGLIDTQLFLDLNEGIGGWNIDVDPIPARHVGDDEAIRIAYETGRVTSGGAGLSQVPIIDDRSYLDDVGNFHASMYSFVTRARLLRDNGHVGNYVMRRHGREHSLVAENLRLMDTWLANLRADASADPLLDRIVRARPADLADDCIAPTGERLVETPAFDMDRLFDNTATPCNQLYPPHAGLRLVAGGPLTNDVLKCALKPIDPNDYRVPLTAAELARLRDIFPEGVCDWSQPGVHQQINQTWLSFGPSPVNRYRP